MTREECGSLKQGKGNADETLLQIYRSTMGKPSRDDPATGCDLTRHAPYRSFISTSVLSISCFSRRGQISNFGHLHVAKFEIEGEGEGESRAGSFSRKWPGLAGGTDAKPSKQKGGNESDDGMIVTGVHHVIKLSIVDGQRRKTKGTRAS
jgi:hypothetical protein